MAAGMKPASRQSRSRLKPVKNARNITKVKLYGGTTTGVKTVNIIENLKSVNVV